MSYNIKKDENGFTLLEVLVVIFIVGLLSGIMLAGYNKGNESNRLTMAVEKLASDIRLAQNHTLGAVKYGTSTPDGGWGIHIDLSDSVDSYKMFANENYNDGNNLEYDTGEAQVSKGGNTYFFEEGVEIASTSVGDVLDLTFIPPDPDTVIYNSAATSTEVEIELKNIDNNTKRIRINSYGLIEVIP